MIKIARTRRGRRARRLKKQVVKVQPRKLSPVEQNTLWCLHLGTTSVGRISEAINLETEKTKEILEELSERNLIVRKNFLGQYALTNEGEKQLGIPEVKLDTKIAHENIRPGQETVLWVFAKNSGNAPLNTALLRIVVPKFVSIQRYSSDYSEEGDLNVIEFPLSQLHPGEMQSINFRVKGSLTSGTVASKYKIEVRALVGEAETDKKEINLFVHN